MSYLPTPNNLSKWLIAPVSQIGSYYSKAQQLLAFNHSWRQQPIPLASHSTIANWRATTLVIEVDSSEWATYLHYTQCELLLYFKENWPELESLEKIRWYVKRASQHPKKKVSDTKKLILSQKNKHLLQSVASSLPYPGLQKALYQLASN